MVYGKLHCMVCGIVYCMVYDMVGGIVCHSMIVCGMVYGMVYGYYGVWYLVNNIMVFGNMCDNMCSIVWYMVSYDVWYIMVEDMVHENMVW